MSKLNINEFRSLLFNEKNKILQSLSLNQSIYEVDSDGDDVDKIQCDVLMGVYNKLNDRNSKRLNDLEAALKRINDNSFGICEDCEEDIPYKRLLFNPCITTCVCCAEARES